MSKKGLDLTYLTLWVDSTDILITLVKRFGPLLKDSSSFYEAPWVIKLKYNGNPIVIEGYSDTN